MYLLYAAKIPFEDHALVAKQANQKGRRPTRQAADKAGGRQGSWVCLLCFVPANGVNSSKWIFTN
jgi:hypothetical protein